MTGIVWQGWAELFGNMFWLVVTHYEPADEGSSFEPPSDAEIEFHVLEEEGGEEVDMYLEGFDEDEVLCEVLDAYEREAAEDRIE